MTNTDDGEEGASGRGGGGWVRGPGGGGLEDGRRAVDDDLAGGSWLGAVFLPELLLLFRSFLGGSATCSCLFASSVVSSRTEKVYVEGEG